MLPRPKIKKGSQPSKLSRKPIKNTVSLVTFDSEAKVICPLLDVSSPQVMRAFSKPLEIGDYTYLDPALEIAEKMLEKLPNYVLKDIQVIQDGAAYDQDAVLRRASRIKSKKTRVSSLLLGKYLDPEFQKKLSSNGRYLTEKNVRNLHKSLRRFNLKPSNK